MSIDSLCKCIMEKLTAQEKILAVSQEMLLIKNNDERVLYVYYLMRDMNCFPRVIEVPKTEKVSTHYRNLGNQYFKKSQDYKAWQYYNLSLMHAPTHSDHFVLALANRSAVFFSLKKYEECLKDIEKVLSMQFPDRLKDKLLKRQSACLSAPAGNTENEVEKSAIKDVISMKGPRHDRYVSASSKLNVVYNREMGWHVLAKEDIKIGEVLVEEDPYFALLLKCQLLFTCSYCLSRKMNLLPCDSCCFALYCSEKCKEKAWQEYHKTECLLMPTLIHMEFTKLELLALRTSIKARTDHEDWPSLFETIRNAESYDCSDVKGCIKVGKKFIFDSKYYGSIHTLASNIEKRKIADIFQKSITAAVFLKLLCDATDFINCENDVEREKIKRCVAGLLLLHCMTSPTNMHGLSTNAANEHGNYINEIDLASAPYAFHSFLNHSCAPNVVRFSRLGATRMTLFALRSIKKGMQLFDNYGSHHAVEDVETRQKHLQFQYKFKCHCEACIDQWPTYYGLGPSPDLPDALRQQKEKLLCPSTIAKLEKGDKRIALEIVKPLCDLMEALDQYAPCKVLADCQESLKQCFAIFQGFVTYGYTQTIKWKAIPPQV